MNTEEAVSKGQTSISAAETALLTAQKKLANLPSVFAAVRDAGFMENGSSLGSLEALELSAEARAIAGDVAAAELKLATFHRKLTARCVDLGIELIQPFSGTR